MSGSGPRAGGPSRRRSFAPAEKLRHLTAYDQACQVAQGGAYLRREGLYSSQVTEWRKLRDAGVLEGEAPGARVGRPSVEQAEIAQLRAQLERAQRRLARTEVALDLMGKAHALGGDLRERAGATTAQAALMNADQALTAAGVTTRAAAGLTGVARATAPRTAARAAARESSRTTGGAARRAGRVRPANRLTDPERAQILAVLNSPEFVDRTPVQVYAALLEAGRYLCSVSSMYRILAANAQVTDRRRLVRHPARVRPELVATGLGQVLTWDITKLRGPHVHRQNPGPAAPVNHVQDTPRTAPDNDRVGGAQVDPVLGREVEEPQQNVEVVGILRGRVGPLRPVELGERPGCLFGVFAVLGVPDLGERGLRRRLRGLRQTVEDVGDLVEPAPVLAGAGEHRTDRRPKPQRPVTDREHRCRHPAAPGRAEQVDPRLGRLTVPVVQGDELLGAISADPDHHQQAHLGLLEADLEVDPVDPHVDVVAAGE